MKAQQWEGNSQPRGRLSKGERGKWWRSGWRGETERPKSSLLKRKEQVAGTRFHNHDTSQGRNQKRPATTTPASLLLLASGRATAEREATRGRGLCVVSLARKYGIDVLFSHSLDCTAIAPAQRAKTGATRNATTRKKKQRTSFASSARLRQRSWQAARCRENWATNNNTRKNAVQYVPYSTARSQRPDKTEIDGRRPEGMSSC